MFSWSRQRWKDVLLLQTHDVQKEYEYDPTDRLDLRIDLLYFASLFFANDTHVLVHLTLHCWALFVVMLWRETHQRTSCEVTVDSCHFGYSLQLVGKPGHIFWIECPCWFMYSVWWEDWTAASDSYFVFATELNCWYPNNEDWTCQQRNISKLFLKLFPLCPNSFPFTLLLVGGGLEGLPQQYREN